MRILGLFFERMSASYTVVTSGGPRYAHAAAADPALARQRLGDHPQIVRNDAQPDPPLHARVPMISTAV